MRSLIAAAGYPWGYAGSTVVMCVTLALFGCGDSRALEAAMAAKMSMDSAAPLQSAIIGGRAALPHEFASTGAVLRRARSGSWDPDAGLCTGTLIAPNAVLTAAHCVLEEAAERLVFVVGSDVQTTAQPAYAVERVVAHSHYVDTMLDVTEHNDIALLFLQHAVPNVDPVSWLRPEENDQLIAGAPCTIVGYGRRDPSRRDSSGIKHYGTAEITEVGTHELTIGTPRRLPRKCDGDSGGPTFVEIWRDEVVQQVQIGIASHLRGVSHRCGQPAVDTRLDAYDAWLRHQLDDG